MASKKRMTSSDPIAAIERALEGVTPGPWKAVSDPHFDSGLVYTSVQPINIDEAAMKPLAMANGEYHVCRMSHTAAPWRFNYHRANATYIAACNPVAITALLSLARKASSAEARVSELERENAELREALKPFARIGEMEKRAQAGSSVMVNVDRCRDAKKAFDALSLTKDEPDAQG